MRFSYQFSHQYQHYFGVGDHFVYFCTKSILSSIYTSKIIIWTNQTTRRKKRFNKKLLLVLTKYGFLYLHYWKLGVFYCLHLNPICTMQNQNTVCQEACSQHLLEWGADDDKWKGSTCVVKTCPVF